jgi:hypothetical protein
MANISIYIRKWLTFLFVYHLKQIIKMKNEIASTAAGGCITGGCSGCLGVLIVISICIIAAIRILIG